MPYRDISNQRFGRLTALYRVKNSSPTRWLFRCVCGVEKEIRFGHVTGGAVKSCGCLHLERCKTGANRRVHGDAPNSGPSRLHNIWRGMHKRCNPQANKHAIKNYASRGISVCAEWQDYSVFKVWALANGYGDNLTLERNDVNGNYEPNNCSWVTHKEQCRNRRTTRWIEVDGIRKCLSEWLEITGVTRSAFYARQERGWSLERALGVRA